MSGDLDDTLVLLQRWHRNDRSALDQLLERHLPLLHHFVSRKLDQELPGLRRGHDSSDFVQTAAVRVLGYQPRYMPRDGGQFQSLLRRLVINEIKNQLRSKGLQLRESVGDRFGDSVLDLRGSTESAQKRDPVVEQCEDRELAWMASQFLDDEDRTLVQLRAVDELDWPAIGLAVGLAPDAARMRYQRLLPRLANYVRKLREGKIDELLVEESERAPS